MHEINLTAVYRDNDDLAAATALIRVKTTCPSSFRCLLGVGCQGNQVSSLLTGGLVGVFVPFLSVYENSAEASGCVVGGREKEVLADRSRHLGD